MCIRSNKNPGVIVSFICVGYFFSFSRSYRTHRRMYDIYIYFLFFLLYLRYFPNVDSLKSFFPLLSLKFPILFMLIYKLRLLRKRAIHITAINKSVYFNIWCVCLSDNPEEWRWATCTCPSFLKNYICMHVIGMSIRLKYFKPPPEAKNVEVGTKRKRGRPSKARNALWLQYYINCSFSFFLWPIASIKTAVFPFLIAKMSN